MSTSPSTQPSVLIVTSEFPPVGGGGVVRMAKLARYLPGLGIGVEVLCTEPIAVPHADPALLAELPPGVRITRVARPLRPPAVVGPGGSGPTTRTWRRRARGAVRDVLRRTRDAVSVPDAFIWWALHAGRSRLGAASEVAAVVASGPPHSSLIAGVLVGHRLRRPVILDLRDEWTLNPYYQRTNRLRLLIERRLEAWCIGRARMLVFVSETSATRYGARYPAMSNRIRVIPNGYDPADMVGIPARPAQTPSTPIVICHAGSLHGRRDASTFFASLGRVIARRPGDARPIELVLLGIVGEKQAAAARTAVPEDSLRIESFVPHRDAIARAAQSDVLLLVTNTEEAGPAALTGKVYEYLALRRPILAITPPGPAADLIQQAHAGVSADPTDGPAVERAIEEVLRLAEDSGFSGADGDLLARFDRQRQAAVWAELIREVDG